MHKFICKCTRENRVKHTDQINAECLIQNWTRLVFDTMSLNKFRILHNLFSDSLSLLDISFPRYND